MDEKNKSEIISAAKSDYKGDLFVSEFTFEDRDRNLHEMFFVYREPNAGEIAFYTRQVNEDQNEANKNLMRSVIVAPSADEVMSEVGENFSAVTTFVQDYINPLYGIIKHKEPIRRV